MKENTTNEAQYSKNPENKLINCSIGVIHINTSHKNDLLNKKRKPDRKDDDKCIEIDNDNIRKLMKERGIIQNIQQHKLSINTEKEKYLILNSGKDKEKGKKKEKEFENEDKKIGEEKVYMQQANTIREWYQKLNFLPNLELDDNSFEENEDDEKYENLNWVENSNDINNSNNKITEEENGIIKFNSSENKKSLYPHYIFLKNENAFDISAKNKIYSWKIKFLTTSDLIGVGLAYKDIVLKNKNKFLDDQDSNYNNGVFALIQTYNPQIKKYCIRPWNCTNKNLVNYVANFPSFKKGKEIIIKYDTNKERIEFKVKKDVHIMANVKLHGLEETEDNNMIMVPCVIFYQSGDKVKIYNYKEEENDDKLDDIETNNNKDK